MKSILILISFLIIGHLYSTAQTFNNAYSFQQGTNYNAVEVFEVGNKYYIFGNQINEVSRPFCFVLNNLEEIVFYNSPIEISGRISNQSHSIVHQLSEFISVGSKYNSESGNNEGLITVWNYNAELTNTTSLQPHAPLNNLELESIFSIENEFIVVGFEYSSGINFPSKIVFFKLDNNLNEVSRTYATLSQNSVPYGAALNSDQQVVVAGRTYNDFMEPQLLQILFDSNNQEIQLTTIPFSENQIIFGMLVKPDNNILLAGNEGINGQLNARIWEAESTSINDWFEQDEQPNEQSQFRGITQIDSSNLLAIGFADSVGVAFGYLAKTDFEANSIWSRKIRYSDFESSFLNSAKSTTDNGIIAVGITQEFSDYPNYSTLSIWVVKLNNQGELNPEGVTNVVNSKQYEPSFVRIYPNPGNVELKIAGLDNTASTFVEIYDITGRLISTHTFQQGDVQVTIPTAHYSKGSYIIKITNGHQISRHTWILGA